MPKITTLPEGVVLRFVAFEGDTNAIHDVCEYTTREDFRRNARIYLGFEGCKTRLEVVSENERLTGFGADLVKGIPAKCRTEQPCLKVDTALVSLDRFWELLCESVAEVMASK